ncbi:MBL fold metallo-hydrolase [Chloroflexota bacterium]
MQIRWLGHASFMITSAAGVRIITDPYQTSETVKYGDIDEPADVVTISHEHGDHNHAAAVRGNPEIIRSSAAVSGIDFKSIATCHDDARGQQRGKNTVFCFEVDGIRVCHLGDLGHFPDDNQVVEMGEVDVLLIPVGGNYTIDAAVAIKLCDRLTPRVVIPMHYKTDKLDYPVSGVDEFLKDKEDVVRMPAAEVKFEAGELPAPTRIVVLQSAR